MAQETPNPIRGEWDSGARYVCEHRPRRATQLHLSAFRFTRGAGARTRWIAQV